MFLDSEALKNDKQYLCQFIRENNFIHNFFSVAEIFISYNSSTKKCPFPSLQMFKYEIRNTKLKANIHFACLGHCMNVHPALHFYSPCVGELRSLHRCCCSREPWRPLHAGNDEVTQQAGLKLGQLALWSVPMLTEVLQWAWCYSFCPTPALPFCCFFISLVLAQSVAQLARPTMWTHSCCRALGPFQFTSISGHTFWPQSSRGIKDQVAHQTHSLTQSCKLIGLWCAVIMPGLWRSRQHFTTAELRSCMLLFGCSWYDMDKIDHLLNWEVWSTQTDGKVLKQMKAFFFFRRELEFWRMKS